MATIKFNNYLKVQLQDPEFKAGYEIESAKLSSAVVTMKAWEAAWLINHAADYGFVLRFTKAGEKSTGIDYESWHFRYVGKASAQYMTKHKLTLEQYVSLLKAREQTNN